jgi:hypothetical protein
MPVHIFGQKKRQKQGQKNQKLAKNTKMGKKSQTNQTISQQIYILSSAKLFQLLDEVVYY